MGTSFTKIYERTLSQYIDDFALKKYNGSIIAMNQDLQSYLLSAIPEFNTPISIIGKIQDYSEAEGKTEEFTGDGITTSFVLSTEPIENSIIEVTVDSIVVTNGYEYNEETKTISFDIAPEENVEILISWYFSGEFTNELNLTEQNILSDLMVWKWLLRERDNIADIRRLLRDTDYSLWSEDKTMTSKAKLADIAREKASKSMKQYAWSIYNKNMNQTFGLPNYASIK